MLHAVEGGSKIHITQILLCVICEQTLTPAIFLQKFCPNPMMTVPVLSPLVYHWLRTYIFYPPRLATTHTRITHRQLIPAVQFVWQ